MEVMDKGMSSWEICPGIKAGGSSKPITRKDEERTFFK